MIRAVSLGLALAACGGAPAAIDCSDVVATPGPKGHQPLARGCVHEVPNGAVVEVQADGSAFVTVGGRVVAVHPPCPCN